MVMKALIKNESAISVTKWLIILTILIWIVWDIYVAVAHTEATESEVIRDWATAHPSFGFGVGVLMGHWFFNFKKGAVYLDYIRPWGMYAVWTIIGLGMIVDVGLGLFGPVYPAISFILGIIFGAVLWPMDRSKALGSEEV
jgi:hypothetical protein